MSRVILSFLVVFLFLTNSCASHLQKDSTYIVKYKYVDEAVSPVVGVHRYELLIKNNKVKQVLDLKHNLLIPKEKAHGLNEVMDTLLKNSTLSNYKIKPSNYITIYIYSIKKVNSNYTLDPLVEREKELKENYQKWLKHNIKSYIIRIQDSAIANEHKEGVELVIKNGKIIKAKDIRTYKEIDPNNKAFLTVKKLFGIAKWGIKDAVIDYNIKYGYPSLIKTNKTTIIAYYLKPL